MCAVFDVSESLFVDVLEGHLVQDIAQIRIGGVGIGHGGLIDPKNSRKSDSIRLRILSFINDHYRTVTLEDVANHFNYSVTHRLQKNTQLKGKPADRHHQPVF